MGHASLYIRLRATSIRMMIPTGRSLTMLAQMLAPFDHSAKTRWRALPSTLNLALVAILPATLVPFRLPLLFLLPDKTQARNRRGFHHLLILTLGLRILNLQAEDLLLLP